MKLVRGGLVLLVVLGTSVVGPASASADSWRPVPTSCVRAAALTGCTTIANASGLRNVAVAPDGKTAYATAFGADTVVIFDRNPDTGALTRRAGAAGCVHEATAAGCTAVRGGLHNPDGIVVSQDGRSVYVAAWNYNGDQTAVNGSLAVLRRGEDGSLAFGQCFSSNGASANVAGRCTVGRGLTGARDVVISADQRTVYAGPHTSIATFDRDTSNGDLTQLGGTAGCVTSTNVTGCFDSAALGSGGRQFSVSPDDENVYASGSTSLVILKRRTENDANHGALSQEPGTQSCYATTTLGGECQTMTRLAGGSAALASQDGRNVYVSTSAGPVVFTRNSTSTLAFRSCVNDGGTGGCSAGKNVNGLTYLALAPDGEDLVGSIETAPKGLTMLARDSNTGDLSQRTGTNETCVSTTGAAFDGGVATTATGGCVVSTALAGDGHVTFASANHLYGTSEDGGGGVTVKRDFAPVCRDQSVTVTRDTSFAFSFNCTDRNGDPLTYDVPNAPGKANLAAIDHGAGLVFYNPFGGYVGPDTFTYRATAPPQSSNVATATLNVVEPPPAPQPNPGGIDADKDGFFAGQDCNDTNAAIRPGAIEIKGNRIDENCDGFADPFPTLTSGVVSKWNVKGTRLTLTTLQVTQQFPRGWKAKILCKGSKCPFKSKDLKAGKVSNAAATIISSLSKSQRKFRAGQTVEVWVSAPNYNTKVARLVLRKGKIPTTQPFCVLPGETKPKKTCT